MTVPQVVVTWANAGKRHEIDGGGHWHEPNYPSCAICRMRELEGKLRQAVADYMTTADERDAALLLVSGLTDERDKLEHLHKLDHALVDQKIVRVVHLEALLQDWLDDPDAYPATDVEERTRETLPSPPEEGIGKPRSSGPPYAPNGTPL